MFGGKAYKTRISIKQSDYFQMSVTNKEKRFFTKSGVIR